ncbi:MAG TPA: thioredoxin family protein [Terriglobales bacterium]|nr:thioredoxin family protein [Terriglobales bacterium]
MKWRKAYVALAFTACVTGWGRGAGAQTGTQEFAPVEHWRKVVLTGDQRELAALYVTNPRILGPGDKPQTVAEETAYWSNWKDEGLVGLSAKIEEEQEPQPGLHVVLMEVTLTARSGGSTRKSYLAMAQGWIQQSGEWKIVLVQRHDAARLPQPIENKDIYPTDANAVQEISEALKTAAKSRRRVLLVFGGNWCYDCHVLDEAFHSPEIAPTLNQNYVVVHVDIGEYNKNLDLAKKYEVPLNKGVPAIAVMEADGKLLFSQKRGEFEAARSMAPEDILAFLRKWKPERKGG